VTDAQAMELNTLAAITRPAADVVVFISGLFVAQCNFLTTIFYTVQLPELSSLPNH
jgi:hypothetical protein